MSKGVMEVDCSRTPPPAVGTSFDFPNGGVVLKARVTRTGKLKTPVTRQMGILTVTMTHMVEFET